MLHLPDPPALIESALHAGLQHEAGPSGVQLPRKLSDWMGKRCSWGLLVLGLLLFASSPVAAQGRHAEGEGCFGFTSLPTAERHVML